MSIEMRCRQNMATHNGTSDSSITLFETPARATHHKRDQAKANATKKYATMITKQFFLIAVHAVKRLTLAKGILLHTALA